MSVHGTYRNFWHNSICHITTTHSNAQAARLEYKPCYHSSPLKLSKSNPIGSNRLVSSRLGSTVDRRRMYTKRTIVNGVIVDERVPLLPTSVISSNTVENCRDRCMKLVNGPWFPLACLLILIVIFSLLLFFTDSKYLVIINVLLMWTLCLSVHEFSHAYVAHLGGDEGIAEKGYLYLNPLKYTDPIFSFVVPIVVMIFSGGVPLFGGAVYINLHALYSRSWHTYVALAGPLGTLVCFLVLSIPLLVFGKNVLFDHDHLEWWGFIALSAYLQAVALIFNLIPIPPLDGFKAILPWLPSSWREYYNQNFIWMDWVGIVILLFLVSPYSGYEKIVARIIDLFGIPWYLIWSGYSHTFLRTTN